MVAGILLATMLFSCKSDIEKIRELNEAQGLPSLKVRNLNGRLTERGVASMKVVSPIMLQYGFAEEKYTDFPEGVEFYRYKDSVTLEASVMADKAVFWEAKNLWEATGNVRVRNAKGELLETEKLFWDQNSRKIYTDAWVKITNKDMVINGEGLTSDETFDSYEIKKVSNSHIYVADKKKQ
jgi:LPS export ABC transporter protein LptC